MRLIVGDTSITDVLTEKRETIEREVQDKIKTTLDRYESGIQVTTVKLQDVNPPSSVKVAYDEVNEARLQKETTINQARQEYLREIPQARGEARKMEAEAEGFKVKRTKEAEGDVAKFKALFAEYRRAPEVTRARLYLETLATVLPKLSHIYIVDEGSGGPVQVLDLKQAVGGVLRSRRPDDGARGATSSSTRATTPRASGRRTR
jgi:membrane protease subunit HflK